MVFLGSRRAEVDEDEKLLKILTSTTDDRKNTALFACGGKLTIDDDEQQPITIRYDCKEAGSGLCTKRITLPTEDASARSSLLEACYGDNRPLREDDGGHPQAGIMEAAHFSTNFNPYEAGIIEAIAKYLHPMVDGSEMFVSRSIRAELVRMTAVSGPPGIVSPRTDMVHSRYQFGELVVCLPFHEQKHDALCGGMDVRVGDQKANFSWMGFPNNTIAWAAYVRDSIPRFVPFGATFITLTYKLFDDRVQRLQTPLTASLGTVSRFVERLLRSHTFLKDGCTLGINCRYNYAHTSAAYYERIGSALKGIDYALYRAFVEVGLRVRLRPVLKPGPHDRYLRPYKLGRGDADAEAEATARSSRATTAYAWSESEGNSADEDFVPGDLDEDQASDVSSEDIPSGEDLAPIPTVDDTSLWSELCNEMQQVEEQRREPMIKPKTEPMEEAEQNGLSSDYHDGFATMSWKSASQPNPHYTGCGRNWAAVSEKHHSVLNTENIQIGDLSGVEALLSRYKVEQNFRWANEPKHEELAYFGPKLVPDTSKLQTGSTSLAIVVDIPPYVDREAYHAGFATSYYPEDDDGSGSSDENKDEDMDENLDEDMDIDMDDEEEQEEEDEEEGDDEEEEEDEEEEGDQEDAKYQEEGGVGGNEEEKRDEQVQEEEDDRGRKRYSIAYRPKDTAVEKHADGQVTRLAWRLDVVLSTVCEQSSRKRYYEDEDEAHASIKKRRVGRPKITPRSKALPNKSGGLRK